MTIVRSTVLNPQSRIKRMENARTAFCAWVCERVTARLETTIPAEIPAFARIFGGFLVARERDRSVTRDCGAVHGFGSVGSGSCLAVGDGRYPRRPSPTHCSDVSHESDEDEPGADRDEAEAREGSVCAGHGLVETSRVSAARRLGLCEMAPRTTL